MSWLSSITGIGINPLGKTKVKIDPLKAIGTGLSVASMGGLSGIGAALGHIPGAAAAGSALGTAAKAIPGATALGNAVTKVPGVNTLLHGFGTPAQSANGAGAPAPSGGSYGGPNEAPSAGVWDTAGGNDATSATAPTQAGSSIWDNIGGILKTPGVIPAIGDVAGGVLQGQAEAAKLKQEQQQFNRTQGLTENTAALSAERQAAASPLRDQAIYMLQQRMGAPTGPLQPHDIFNQSYGSGPANLGGISPQNRALLQQANAKYTPGAGGVNQALYQAFIKKYGGQS